MNIETYQKIHSKKSFDWDRWNIESKKVRDEMTPDIEKMIKEEARKLLAYGGNESKVMLELLAKVRQIRSDAEDRLFEEKFA